MVLSIINVANHAKERHKRFGNWIKTITLNHLQFLMTSSLTVIHWNLQPNERNYSCSSDSDAAIIGIRWTTCSTGTLSIKTNLPQSTYYAALSVRPTTAPYSSLCPHLPTCYFVLAASTLNEVHLWQPVNLRSFGTVGWATGRASGRKTLGVGLLVVTIWLELSTSYRSSCHYHLHHP